ncbi:MAG: DUF3987 domain-containing protein [Proteobacteria bacterium]|nr:MAG: DUF3987 domain-containing protein [Pseudomonadota bacterium]
MKSSTSLDVLSFYSELKNVSLSEAIEHLEGMIGIRSQTPLPISKSKGFDSLEEVKKHYIKKSADRNYKCDYVWKDLDGKNLKVVYRFERKSEDFGKAKEFPQAFFFRNKWFLCKPHNLRDPAPYLWDEISNSPVIFICEGEKDTETARRLGIPATTTGSSVSWKSDYVQLFQGKSVVLIPDQDKPGRSYAEAIAKDLKGHVLSLKVINLPGPEGIDFTEWVDAGGTKVGLEELIRAAPDLIGRWDDPKIDLVDFDRIPLIDVDEMLPESLRYYLEYLAEDLQCPIDSVAAPAFAGLGTLIGRKLLLLPKTQNPHFKIAAPTWCMLIADAGQRKTQILREALRPLFAIEDKLASENEILMSEVATKLVSARARERHLESILEDAVKKNDVKGEANMQEQLAEVIRTKEKLLSVGPRQLVTRDTSPEKALEIFCQNPDGVMHFADELSGFFRFLEKGYTDQRKMYLELWQGGKIDVRRKSFTLRGDSIVSIVGGVQTDWIKHKINDALNGEAENDGFLNRFSMIINHDKRLDYWKFVNKKPLPTVREMYEKIFQKALEFNTSEFIPGWKEGSSCAIYFSEEAEELSQKWVERNENNITEESYPSALGSHFSKYTTLFGSLSLIFHVVLCFEETTDDYSKISLLAAQLAERWCDHFAKHAHKTFTNKGYFPEQVRSMAKQIRKGNIRDGSTIKDILSRGFTHLKNEKALNFAIRELSKYEIVRLQDTGGKSQALRINPKVLCDLL